MTSTLNVNAMLAGRLVLQVGYANYRYFVLFLFYVWLGTWYLAAEAYGPFMYVICRTEQSVSTLPVAGS